MKILSKINESIILSILLPIVAIAALVSVIGVNLLTRSFDSYERAQIESDLKVATQLGVDICEGRFHDLLALRLENDPKMMDAAKNQAREEIKQISQKFYKIHLLVIENQQTIQATSLNFPRDQVHLPKLRQGHSPILPANIWGEPLLVRYQYFPLWRWHIISFIQKKDYTALANFTQWSIYLSVFLGVAIILLMVIIVFYVRVELPLRNLLKATVALGKGEFVTMTVNRRDEIGQVSQAFNEMVENLSAAHQALRNSEATLQSLFRAAPIGMGLLQDRVFLYANEEVSRMTGYSWEELKGKSAKMLYATEDEFQQVGTMKYQEIREHGTGTLESRWRHKDGFLIDVWLSSSFIDPTEPEDGTVFTALDITARRRIEKALKESEARYRELVENANSIILRMDPEGNIRFFNEFAERFFGYSKEEILGLNVVGTIVPPQESSGRDLKALIKDIGLHPDSYSNNENENIKRNGERVWVAWTNKAILDPQGQVTEVLCVGNDITARKQAEAERESALALLQASLAQSPSGILIADAPDVTIRWANTAALSIRGEVDLSLTGIDVSHHAACWQTYRPDGTPYPSEELPLSRAILRGDITRNEEIIILNAKGEKRWVSVNAAPVRNREGAIISGIVIFHDITERKRADEELSRYKDHLEDLVTERTAALTESEARYRAIFDGAAIGIVLRDLDGKFLAGNPAYEKIMGYSQKDLPHLGWAFLHPEDAPRFLGQFQELAVGSRDSFTAETRTFHQDGHLVWGRVFFSRIKGKDDQSYYALGLIEDITAEKQLQAEIATYQERLRALASELTLAEERERRRLAMDLHDHIGQVLALTQIKLGALKEELNNSKITASLDEIRAQLSQVIQATRSLTMELGFQVLDELGLEAGVEWLGEKFQEQHGLTIAVDCKPLQTSLGSTEKTLLFRVVRELLTNVVKHAQAQHVNISLKENSDELRLLVADDGIGLEVSNHPTGNGFGLFSIAERLGNLGGRLNIESAPDKGAQMSITLPLN